MLFAIKATSWSQSYSPGHQLRSTSLETALARIEAPTAVEAENKRTAVRACPVGAAVNLSDDFYAQRYL